MNARRVAVAAILVVLALPFLPGCATPQAEPGSRDSLGRAEIVLHRDDDNRTVGIAVGATFAVELPADHAEGFTWGLPKPPDPSVLAVVSKTYLAPVGPGSGTERWRFRATGPGSIRVTMLYGSISSPGSAAGQFTFIVSVT